MTFCASRKEWLVKMSIFKDCGKPRVLIRGAGDIATGIGHRLFRCGFEVMMTEIASPTCIRRRVAFSEAVYEGITQVEGISAVLVRCPEEAVMQADKGNIPVLIDSRAECLEELKPHIVVDAILAKKNLGTFKEMAPIVIGVGPGFFAGKDCHAAVETMRGHDLGRVILHGEPEKNTGIPGEIAGITRERVIYAERAGTIRLIKDIGDIVEEKEVVAEIDGEPVCSPIKGVLRGIIRDGFHVDKGMKIGDVDPRGTVGNCFSISDKARAVAGGVLEAILFLMNQVLN